MSIHSEVFPEYPNTHIIEGYKKQLEGVKTEQKNSIFPPTVYEHKIKNLERLIKYYEKENLKCRGDTWR